MATTQFACFQLVYNPLNAQVVIIAKDTIVNITWNLQGKTIRFTGGRIMYKGTLKGGIIQAGLRDWIFDTSLTILCEGTYGHDFSASWFGINSKAGNNCQPLQKAINTCLQNGYRSLFIPTGKYNFSKTLQVAQTNQGRFIFSSIQINGELNFWGTGKGTTLKYNATTGAAINLQVNKGTELNNLDFSGQFISPSGPDNVYYNITFDQFTDAKGKCKDSRYTPYSGIAVDNLANPNNSQQGSTGIKVHDIYVGNFVVDVCVSPNGTTRNAEILLFENIHLGDAKVGFATGQAQEKDNVIRQVFSWGRLHTLFVTGVYGARQPGSWYIDGGNITG